MIEFFKKDTEQKTATPEKLDYDKTNKCDKVIKELVENGLYICCINGSAYIRLNSIVVSIRLPSKFTSAFESCLVTDWQSYEVIKPSYGHWTALWENETPSEHATHLLMEKINKAQNEYIDAILKCAQEVKDEPEKIN